MRFVFHKLARSPNRVSQSTVQTAVAVSPAPAPPLTAPMNAPVRKELAEGLVAYAVCLSTLPQEERWLIAAQDVRDLEITSLSSHVCTDFIREPDYVNGYGPPEQRGLSNLVYIGSDRFLLLGGFGGMLDPTTEEFNFWDYNTTCLWETLLRPVPWYWGIVDSWMYLVQGTSADSLSISP